MENEKSWVVPFWKDMDKGRVSPTLEKSKYDRLYGKFKPGGKPPEVLKTLPLKKHDVCNILGRDVYVSTPAQGRYRAVRKKLKLPTPKHIERDSFRPKISTWIFTPSYRRAMYKYLLTLEDAIHILVVRKDEFEEYFLKRQHSHCIIELPDTMENCETDVRSGGIGYARLFVQRMAQELNLEKIFMLDDNILKVKETMTVEGERKEGNLVFQDTTFVCVLRHLESMLDRSWVLPKDFIKYPYDDNVAPDKLHTYTGPPCKYGAIGILNHRPTIGKIKQPFKKTHVYAFVLLNVKALKESHVEYKPWHIREDVGLNIDADKTNLWVCKCNKFCFMKPKELETVAMFVLSDETEIPTEDIWKGKADCDEKDYLLHWTRQHFMPCSCQVYLQKCNTILTIQPKGSKLTTNKKKPIGENINRYLDIFCPFPSETSNLTSLKKFINKHRSNISKNFSHTLEHVMVFPAFVATKLFHGKLDSLRSFFLNEIFPHTEGEICVFTAHNVEHYKFAFLAVYSYFKGNDVESLTQHLKKDLHINEEEYVQETSEKSKPATPQGEENGKRQDAQAGPAGPEKTSKKFYYGILKFNCTTLKLYFDEKKIPRDGNCLFEAVARTVKPSETHEQKRKELVKFMDRKKILEKQDLNEMEKDKAWADEKCVQAMAQMLKRRIVVITISTETGAPEHVKEYTDYKTSILLGKCAVEMTQDGTHTQAKSTDIPRQSKDASTPSTSKGSNTDRDSMKETSSAYEESEEETETPCSDEESDEETEVSVDDLAAAVRGIDLGKEERQDDKLQIKDEEMQPDNSRGAAESGQDVAQPHGDILSFEDELNQDFSTRNIISGESYKIKEETVKFMDIQTLRPKQWISDKVINAFLSVVLELGDDNFFSMTSYMFNIWQTGKMDERLFQEVKMAAFKYIFMPVNPCRTHWALVVADPKTRSVSVLDSAPDSDRRMKIITTWKEFMECRGKIVGELEGGWEEGNIRSKKQSDGYSCGDYVMLNALAIVKGYPTENVTDQHLNVMREYVKWKLLQKAITPASQSTPPCDYVNSQKPTTSAMWEAGRPQSQMKKDTSNSDEPEDGSEEAGRPQSQMKKDTSISDEPEDGSEAKGKSVGDAAEKGKESKKKGKGKKKKKPKSKRV